MKKAILIMYMIFLVLFAQGQSFFTNHQVYLGIDWGLTENSSLNKIEINSGKITALPTFGEFLETKFSFNLGFVKGANTFELGYQTVKNIIAYNYDLPTEEKILSTKIITDESNFEEMDYWVLRYYRNLKNDGKWQINGGIGVGIAKFNDLFVRSDSSNLGGASSSLKVDIDPKNIYTVDFKANEELYSKVTPSIEANLKLSRNLGKYIDFNLWIRYIYSPWYIRGERFEITKSNNSEPSRFGSAKANMNSFGFGIGLQYKFSNHFIPKELKEGYVDNADSYRKDGIYTSLSICTTNPKGTDYPAINRNFLAGVSSLEYQATDFHLLMGYQMGKHSFETGIGTQKSIIAGQFDPKGTFTDYENVIGFSSELTLVVVPLRYYYELVRLRHWHLKVGGGLLNYFVPDPDFLNGVSGIGKEERLKSYALSGDVSAKIGYSFNESWGINIIGSYGLGAPNIRRLDFSKTNPITPLYATAKAYNIGLNLQYNF